MNFWQEPDWIKLKQSCAMKTERLLSRLEYLKEVGWESYSEEKYKQYLEAMKESKNNVSN